MVNTVSPLIRTVKCKKGGTDDPQHSQVKQVFLQHGLLRLAWSIAELDGLAETGCRSYIDGLRVQLTVNRFRCDNLRFQS